MAETGRLRQAATAAPVVSPVTLLRIAIVLGVLAIWEFLAHSGWLYRDVVPSLLRIGAALIDLLSHGDYYFNLGVTVGEIAAALAIGGIAGLAVGILLGANRFLSKAYESLSLLSRPDAEDHLLPDHDHVVRGRPGVQGRARHAVLLLPDRAVGRRRHAPDRQGADPRRPELPRQHHADGVEDLSAGDAPSDHQRRAAGLGRWR